MNKYIVFLTGFSGTGKTTVGRQVAKLLSWRFIDIDEEISFELGQDISQVFASQGEPTFRDLEHKKLLEVVADDNLIISTGSKSSQSKNLWFLIFIRFVCVPKQ